MRDRDKLKLGKVADGVLLDGDPFETTTHVTHVLLGGSLVYDRAAELKNPHRSSGLSCLDMAVDSDIEFRRTGTDLLDRLRSSTNAIPPIAGSSTNEIRPPWS